MADAEETNQQEPQEQQQEQQEQQEPQDQQQEQQQDQQEDVKPEAGDKKFSVARFLPQIIIVVVVVLFAGAGFTLGRLFAGSSTPQTPGASELGRSSQLENPKGPEDDSQEKWYYHLEPVIANLDVDDVTRYVKASLTLEISSEMDEKKGRIFLDEKKPILTNSLTVYLASLGLEDIRGDMNLKRIQSHILDDFNEKLFPGSKFQIKRILFKEFAVQ